MARWIVFTDNVFWKYSWAYVVISITVAFLYVMQCRLRARRSRASSMVFRPWPLRTEIVPDSLNLWMILCTVDDDNFKLFAVFLWETPFWYCSTIFRRSIGGIGDPLPILTSERHCHSERLFLYPIMLPIDLISCKLVLQLFLICTFNFSGLLLLPVPTFLECVALMKSKWANIWHDISKCLTFNIWYVIYILLWIKYKFMRFVNYCIPFLFTICTVSQLFWNWVVNINLKKKYL